MYPACMRRFRARCTASARSAEDAPFDTVADFDEPFEAATLTAGVSPTLSMNETSASGLFFDATGLTSATFVGDDDFADETVDFDVDDVDVALADFAAVATDLVPLLFAALAAL